MTRSLSHSQYIHGVELIGERKTRSVSILFEYHRLLLKHLYVVQLIFSE